MNRSPLDLVPAASGIAAFFLLLELLKAVRSSQWAGFMPEDVAGALLGFLAYTTAAGLLMVGLGRLFGKSRLATALAWPATGLVLWGVLSLHREQAPTADDGLVIGVLTLSGVALALGGWSVARFGAAMLAAGLAGIGALCAAASWHLYAPDRAEQVTMWAGAGFSLSTIVLLILALKAWGWRFHLTSVALVLTPAFVVQLLLAAPARDGGETRPNLVFVIADTLRADYTSAYGGQVPTPALEELAARGVRFSHSYSLAPWTLPSMTGLVGSQYPKSLTPGGGHTAWSLQMNRYAVAKPEDTLITALRDGGYATGAFTGNAFLPVTPGLLSGYETHADSHPILLREEGYFGALPFLGALVAAWLPPLADIRPHNTTRDLDYYARRFIERHRDKPFALWIHYIDPHAPYDPPAALRRVPDGPWPFFHPYAGGEVWGLPILGRNFEVAEEDQDYVKSLYEGEVAYIDRFVGTIDDALEAAGLKSNTVFCFTSDHGEELWDHGAWGHGHSLYEEQVRVPLIVAGPGVAPGVVKTPVSAIDLMPSLADLLGVPPKAHWRGESLGPVMRGGGAAPEKPIFFQGTTNKTETPLQGVVANGYKLIRVVGTKQCALYDLNQDPGEHFDLSATQPQRVEAMSALLDAWMGTFEPLFEEESELLNPDLEQGLEGMGYL